MITVMNKQCPPLTMGRIPDQDRNQSRATTAQMRRVDSIAMTNQTMPPTRDHSSRGPSGKVMKKTLYSFTKFIQIETILLFLYFMTTFDRFFGKKICFLSSSLTAANGHQEKSSLYVNVDNYRKSSRSHHRDDHHRNYRSHSHDSADRNHHHTSTATLTRRSKPKRVESFIKKFDTINFWKRRDSKDKSPSPANPIHSNGDTLKRTKNIFNLIASSKKSTRDVGIECKLDQEEQQEKYDHFDSSYPLGNDMGLRKSSVQSLNEEIPKYRRASKPKVYEHGSSQLLTSIIKTPDRRYNYKSTVSTIPTTATTRVGFDVKSRGKYSPSPPMEYDDIRRRPVGVASPQPQIRSRSVLKNGNSTLKKQSTTLKSTRLLSSIENNNNHDDELERQGSDRMSFREYRERLLKAKNENNRRLADNSDDELRKSHQQSFFVPI